MADLGRNRKGLGCRATALLRERWLPVFCASLLAFGLQSPLAAGPLQVHYNWHTGEFTVVPAHRSANATRGARRQILAFLQPNLFYPGWPGGEGSPQMTPSGLTQVSLAAFDAVNNALRIRAGVTPPGGQVSPSDADQVFTSIFDSTFNALRVNCVAGCGGSGSGPGGANTAVQFNSSGIFGGDTANFYYNTSSHSLGLTGGLSLGIPLPVSSGGTGTSTPGLAAGANIAVSGAWPNQTVALTGILPSSDLPAPTSITLGGVKANAVVAHQWVNSISTSGAPVLSQPSFSDLAGTLALAQLPLGVPQFSGVITAGDCVKWSLAGILGDAGAACGSGTTPPGGLNSAVQFNSSGTFGGDSVNFSYNTSTHSLGITGGLTLGSPLAVSSGGTGTASPTLAAGSNISVSGSWPNQTVALAGVIPSSSLPAPSATTLGGVEAAAAVPHEWINSISAAGAPSLSQPAFSDLSGTAAVGQIPNPAGDVTGTYAATTVTGLHFGSTDLTLGIAPASGQCLEYNGTNITGTTCAGGSTPPGGSTTQYQYNNNTFGGAVSTYNSSTAESTFPNINNVYYVDGNKYLNVEAVIADPNFKGGTIISTVPETFSSSPFQTGTTIYPETLILRYSPNTGTTGTAGLWETNIHIDIPHGDKLMGAGWASTTIEPGPGFAAAVSAPPALGTLTTAGNVLNASIPNGTQVTVVITYANANGETTQSNSESVTTSTSGGGENTVTVPAPGASGDATGMNVYILTASGLYELAASNVSATSSYTLMSLSILNTEHIPPSENTSANLISLAETATGSAPDTRIEKLTVNCNSVASGLGILNDNAQENSGVFWASVINCYGGAIDVETSGAQHSAYEHLNLGGAVSTTYPVTELNVNGAQVRDISDATIIASGASQPPAGSEALSLTNSGGTGGGSGAESCYSHIHIENFEDGLDFHDAPGCADHVTGHSNVGNLVHINSSSFDVTLRDIRADGSTNGIYDATWTTPYQSGDTTTGFYSVGNGTGQARNYIASDSTSNFQNGLTIAGNTAVAQAGTITAGDCAKWNATGIIQDAGAACGSGGSTNPGGSPGQYQINNTTFAGSSTLTNNANAGSGTVQVEAPSDEVAALITGFSTSQTHDILDVCATSGDCTTNNYFKVTPDGNAHFLNSVYANSFISTASSSSISLAAGASALGTSNTSLIESYTNSIPVVSNNAGQLQPFLLGANPANDTTTGTCLFCLTTLTSGGNAIKTSITTTSGVIGVCSGGCGVVSGSYAILANTGESAVAFDGSATAGDYAIISSATAGDAHDSGSQTCPTSGGQVLGRVTVGGTSANNYIVALDLDACANPMTTLGDTIYGGTNGSAVRLGGNTSSTANVLTSTGSGSAAAAPAWSTLASLNVPTQTGTITAGDCVKWSSGTVITDAGAGCGPAVYKADLTAQAANVSATNIVTPAAAGDYIASCYTVVTQQATSGATLPSCAVGWSDADSGTAETAKLTALPSAANPAVGTFGGTGATPVSSTSFLFRAGTGAAITYSTTGYASSGATAMQYAVHFVLRGPF